MEGHLQMRREELERKRLLEGVVEGRLTLCKASALLNISYRQALRICQRFRTEGAKGLVHRSRGRPSNRQYPESVKRKVLKRYEERYAAFELEPTLLAEKLAEEGGSLRWHTGHSTLTCWV